MWKVLPQCAEVAYNNWKSFNDPFSCTVYRKKKASGDIPQCFYMLKVAEMKDLCHAGTPFIS